ncbi:MAG: methyltransferase domain-containing protein, partial [Candidatus Dojkabacteria bacterium]
QEDIYNLQRQDESFDLIFLLEVLEHLDEPKLALEELRRVSSRYLILGVPREPLWRMMNLARGHYIKDLGNTIGHLNHWSKNGIVKYVEKYFGRVIATRSPIPWTLVLAEKMYEA